MALGVSYVNEVDFKGAVHILKGWIANNPRYSGLELDPAFVFTSRLRDGAEDFTPPDAVPELSSALDSSLSAVEALLAQARRHDPSDAAVLEALGVCYNAARRYEAAADCLRECVALRPGDHRLWNKLGATLANGKRSEDALPCYAAAIERKPRYARAWLNLAISHSNLKEYDEAARCFLQTLCLNPKAVHCWSYLRIALTGAERWDLVQHTASQNIEAFEGTFDFVR
jgi:peroxin-5